MSREEREHAVRRLVRTTRACVVGAVGRARLRRVYGETLAVHGIEPSAAELTSGLFKLLRAARSSDRASAVAAAFERLVEELEEPVNG